METVHPLTLKITIDVVFLADTNVTGKPREREPGLVPSYVPLADLAGLNLRPPLAGHLRSLLNSPIEHSAAYLGNLWRPPRTTVKEPTP